MGEGVTGLGGVSARGVYLVPGRVPGLGGVPGGGGTWSGGTCPGTPPPPCEQNDRQVYKHNLRNFVADGNYNFYCLQRSWGKVMFLHVSVILFTGGFWSVGCLVRGGVLGGCLVWGVCSRRGWCLVQTPPPRRLLLRAVCILLDCILVIKNDKRSLKRCFNNK